MAENSAPAGRPAVKHRRLANGIITFKKRTGTFALYFPASAKLCKKLSKKFLTSRLRSFIIYTQIKMALCTQKAIFSIFSYTKNSHSVRRKRRGFADFCLFWSLDQDKE
ncbi:MAG TPA: hypothetical protein IAD23_02240 [Candidatus Scubalenecus merdavium]|uniref:Uncharacterized protein n=1 Tax=Candidatus Scybalenecus merdavium TaxID=2840939 RepID=A0A9D1SMU0_9FIRM|nr:hypothetical protein [Candidatus Scubalenecus merdavium]